MKILGAYCPHCGDLTENVIEWDEHPSSCWLGIIYAIRCAECRHDVLVLTNGDPFDEEIVAVYSESSMDNFIVEAGRYIVIAEESEE